MHALIGAWGVAIAAYHLDEPFQRLQAKPVGTKLVEAQRNEDRAEWRSLAPFGFSVVQKWTLALLAVWVGFQVFMPLRHFAIPGRVHWTEEGHNFSWHMKVRDKESRGIFITIDPATEETWKVDPREYLTPRQARKMTSRPHMVVEFAHYLEDRLREEGHEEVEVRAWVVASLNGRRPQLLIDPDVDLTEVPNAWLGHADWIFPLEFPLQSRD